MQEATKPKSPDRLELDVSFRRYLTLSQTVGGVALLAAMVVGCFVYDGFRRFYFSYLVSFSFFLSISLGALFFVLLQHVTRAGWSVAVRRIPEILAAALPLLGAFSAPIIVAVVVRQGLLYPWAKADAHDLGKGAYLNPFFFVLRMLIYFTVWSALGIWYWRRSVEQDSTRDVAITSRLQAFSAPAIVLYAITVTFASFDLIMSLDPEWFSTIFGVYFFSGSAVAIFATLILLVFLLERNGYLTSSITLEHFHDLGKFLFAFTFFWGYIAFSQYMLIWYANMPDTTAWFARRGATTVGPATGWTVVSLLLLFGHILIPFAGLLSRHVKRNKKTLAFWAVWMLVFHWIDLYWLIMPEFDHKLHFPLMELLCLIGVGGLYCSAVIRISLGQKLRPMADPRLAQSLAFENM